MPARPDVEPVEFARRDAPAGIHALDPGSRGSIVQLTNERLQVVRWTLGDTSHSMAGLVRDPAREAQVPRRTQDEDPETDSMDAPVHDRLEALRWAHVGGQVVRPPSRGPARRRRARG